MQIVDSLFLRNTIRLTPGRLMLSASQIIGRMEADEERAFGALAATARATALEAVRLTRARRESQRGIYGDAARARDEDVDASTALIFALLEALVRAEPDETELGQSSRVLLGALFPAGLAAIVQAPYADELAQLKSLLAESLEPELAAHVARVPGLSAHLARLEVRTQAFREALDRQAASGVSYRDVRAASDRAERRFMEMVSAVLVHHRGDELATVTRRSELLQPYLVQIADLRERYRRRLPATDIDPDTGALIDAEVAEAVAPPEPTDPTDPTEPTDPTDPTE